MEAVLRLSAMLEVGKVGLSRKLVRFKVGSGVAAGEYSLYFFFSFGPASNVPKLTHYGVV